MISNSNVSKEPSEGNFIDVKKYIGVGTVHVLAVNPDNKILRSYGWSIPEDADEPQYVYTDDNGKPSARVRFLVQIQELEDKPIIGMDFWVRPDVHINSDGSKCEIVDSYCRTAWGTKDEVKAHAIPQYANGPASISSDYKPCHIGESNLLEFLRMYLNITPFRMYKDGVWVATKNPGQLTIDNWRGLCSGNVNELREYVSKQPDNKLKVIFGVRTTEDNKSYQTFMTDTFISNGARPDTTGEFKTARKAIDKLLERRPDTPVSFSAMPVKEWKVSATEVSEQSDDMPASFSDPSFFGENPNDLPFGD